MNKVSPAYNPSLAFIRDKAAGKSQCELTTLQRVVIVQAVRTDAHTINILSIKELAIFRRQKEHLVFGCRDCRYVLSPGKFSDFQRLAWKNCLYIDMPKHKSISRSNRLTSCLRAGFVGENHDLRLLRCRETARGHQFVQFSGKCEVTLTSRQRLFGFWKRFWTKNQPKLQSLKTGRDGQKESRKRPCLRAFTAEKHQPAMSEVTTGWM